MRMLQFIILLYMGAFALLVIGKWAEDDTKVLGEVSKIIGAIFFIIATVVNTLSIIGII